MQEIKILLITVINDCKMFFNDYSFIGKLVGAVLAFFYSFILWYRGVCSRKHLKQSFFYRCTKILFIFLFGFYCYLVLGITILSRDVGTVYILNLIPFSTWGTDIFHLTLWVENIFMLMPFGILLYILWAPFRKIGWSMLAGFFFSLSIESIQLFTRLGKFELDDIMNNVFGTLIGFLFCKGISRMCAVIYANIFERTLV